MEPRTALLVDLLRRSFAPVEGDGWSVEHSLLGNLATVREHDLDLLPASAGRTIRDIAHHVGAAYRVYANHGWMGATLSYSDPGLLPGSMAARAALEAWLRTAFAEFLDPFLKAADDAALDTIRPLPWGDEAPAGDIARAMIQHTLYHAGEINHLRALLQGTDRWAWDD